MNRSTLSEVNQGLNIRHAGPGDGPAFVALFNTYYKRKTSLEYFKWQFFHSPFESRLFTAFDKDRLVGIYGIKIIPLTNGIVTGFVVDVLIDESYRRRGIGHLLETEAENFCREKKAAVLSVLPNAAGNAAFKSYGWKSVAKIDTLVMDRPVLSESDNVPVLSESDNVPVLPEGAGVPAGWIDPIDPYIEFAKGREFREWRYDRHPVYKYENIALDNANFAITKAFTDPFNGNRYQDIVEIVYNGPAELRSLLGKIFEQEQAGQTGQTGQTGTLTVWALPHTPLFGFLSDLGFRALQQERFFCLKVLDQRIDWLYQVDKWNLSEIDAEIF